MSRVWCYDAVDSSAIWIFKTYHSDELVSVSIVEESKPLHSGGS